MLNVDRLGDPETAKQERRAFFLKLAALVLASLVVGFAVPWLLLI